MNTRSAQYAALISSAVVAFLVTTWFLAVPLLKQQYQAEFTLSQLNAQYERAKGLSVEQREQIAQADIGEQSELLIPKGDNQYDLLIQLEALGRVLNLPFSTLSVLPNAGPVLNSPVNQGAAKRVSISITVSASYADTQRLIAALPTVNRSIVIDQISLAGGAPVNGAESKLSVSLLASAFYLP